MIGHVVYQIFSHNNNFLFGAKAMFLSDINDKYPILLSFIHYVLPIRGSRVRASGQVPDSLIADSSHIVYINRCSSS